MTVFVTTHYLDEAEYCHRLALIHAGRLVALGTVSELKRVFAGNAVLEVTAPRVGEALEAIGEQPWALETSVFGTRIHVVVRDAERGPARDRAGPRRRRRTRPPRSSGSCRRSRTSSSTTSRRPRRSGARAR